MKAKRKRKPTNTDQLICLYLDRYRFIRIEMKRTILALGAIARMVEEGKI